jgi:endo-1,4-beta-D-glucanase Y
MGNGMLMLVMLAGSEDIVLGGVFGERTMRHVLWSGLPESIRRHFSYEAGRDNSVSFQTYFDAMFRSLRFWPTHPVHVENGNHNWGADVMNNVYRGGNVNNNFRHSYQMAWSIHHVWQGNRPGFFRREAGPSTATDGTMDMAYALILAAEQWGDVPAWSPTHPYERREGYTYHEWARRMVQEIFDVTVHHSRHIGTGSGSTENAGYFLKIGNWANSNQAAGRLSRPSDHMMQHLKAFAEINPERDWQRVINVTYDSHRFIREWEEIAGSDTGILPDFIRYDHNNSKPQPDGTGNVWLIPPQNTNGGSFHETSSDGAAHWNACRVPWRLGVDVLFSGTAPHAHSDKTIQAINTWHAALNDNNFTSVQGRWLDGSPNRTVGATSNAFGGPMLVPAAVFGPQEWFDSGWTRATPANPGNFNFYGDYINILTMIASTGNEWTPVGNELTINGGTTANGLNHMRRVVAGARVPLYADEAGLERFEKWNISGAEFWQGYDETMPNTYIMMPADTAVKAAVVLGAFEEVAIVPIGAVLSEGEPAGLLISEPVNRFAENLLIILLVAVTVVVGIFIAGFVISAERKKSKNGRIKQNIGDLAG